LSSLVKAFLDGALCNFNDLSELALTAALRRNLEGPPPLRPGAGDETRIARLSPQAKNLSASRSLESGIG
jgi:hypothetical protein